MIDKYKNLPWAQIQIETDGTRSHGLVLVNDVPVARIPHIDFEYVKRLKEYPHLTIKIHCDFEKDNKFTTLKIGNK